MQPALKNQSTRQLLRTFSSWSFAIKNAKSPQRALSLYVQMQRQAIPFDSFAILFTLKSCTQLRNLSLICHLHAHLLKLGFNIHVYVATSLLNAYAVNSFDCAYKLFDEIPVRNTVTWNTIITCFSRSGDVKGARKMFDQMPLRDLASWSAMIAGYMNNGHWEEGVALFQEMVMFEQLKPDQVTIGPILAGCSEMGSIGLLLGKSVHSFVVKNHWELNVELGTCLVDMYAKCGFLNFASLVFDMMKDRNVVTWTALICGAAKHGFGTEALEIFKKMRQGGVLPNEFTFTGVLSACVQAGLVDEGRGYFKMIKECGLRPTIQHYGCMVDLFGKAGLLGEAYEVINTMSPEPNIVIWGSFLSSCKLHKQFEMAERVIERVMNVVRPENDGGVYTLISDLYVLGGKWAEAERVRQLMLHQHVRKARGCSFIRNNTI
ncbi:PREDICTED: pentatricopeptide repeat-containing protein At5g66520-like [Nicotiana attenuata]|uniref:Pentatricopeptide repeat-containing protein n=1 Tax=Nicotiana attenuata TaxID=49451 RepID=A0A314L7N6_NICAT|nr:PREDICTED: pentatricopeptide repeat-containing protein At5g66520-like [Nicotiana attenuata]OIT37573.1 pentatricopeptide repeat-containing protein [Nicotiana attenuata]